MVGFFHILFVSPQIRELNIQVDRQRSMFNLVDVDPQDPDNFVAGTAIRQQHTFDWVGNSEAQPKQIAFLVGTGRRKERRSSSTAASN